MMWFLAILVVAALGCVAVVAAGRAGAMPAAQHDRPELGLPDGSLGGDDLRRVRFPLAVRGYRADEVDALLDRLARQLDAGPDSPGDDH